jgi:nitrite reductase/ring-hydroxylating ferredoxin subunit
MEFVEVCASDELWDGEMDAFEMGTGEVLLVKIEGQYHAYQIFCPHQKVSLAEGTLEGKTLTCRAHLWQFDAATGRGINPASSCLKRYPIQVRDGVVFVGTTLEAEAAESLAGGE